MNFNRKAQANGETANPIETLERHIVYLLSGWFFRLVPYGLRPRTRVSRLILLCIFKLIAINFIALEHFS